MELFSGTHKHSLVNNCIMKTENIEIGIIVQLKSGGPRMTVESFGTRLSGDSMSLSSQEDRSKVHCQWFDGKKLLEGTFNVNTLKVVSEGSEGISWGVV